MNEMVVNLLIKHVWTSSNVRLLLLSALFMWGMNDINEKIAKISSEKGIYAGHVWSSWVASLDDDTDMLASIDVLIERNWGAQIGALSTLCEIHYEHKDENQDESTLLDDILNEDDIRRACLKARTR